MLKLPKDDNLYNRRTGGSILFLLQKGQKIPEVEFQYASFVLIQRSIGMLLLWLIVSFMPFTNNRF